MKRRMEILGFEVPALDGKFGTRALPTADDRRIAAIPDANGEPAVLAWLDPAAKWYTESPATSANRNAWIDRAAKQYWLRDNGGGESNASLQPGTSMNGNASIDLDGTTGLFIALADPGFVLLPQNEFTVLIAARGTEGGILLGGNAGTGGNVNSVLYVSTNTGALVSPFGIDSTTTLQDASRDYRDDTPFLAGVTFSATRGMSLRRNGAQVAQDATRTLPRANYRPKWGRQLTDAVNIWSGSFGHAFLINADMSRPEYAAMLAHLEGYIMADNDITPGS